MTVPAALWVQCKGRSALLPGRSTACVYGAR